MQRLWVLLTTHYLYYAIVGLEDGRAPASQHLIIVIEHKKQIKEGSDTGRSIRGEQLVNNSRTLPCIINFVHQPQSMICPLS